MALKTYNLTRPEDGTEFTMLLDDDDRARYGEAGWEPTRESERTATPRTRNRRGKDATGTADESAAEDVIVTG